MKKLKWISVGLATAIHDEAIYEFGGLAGIRDLGLLESALDRPKNPQVDEPRSTLFALAASLCVGIARIQAFNDGNKRTALLSTHAFLYLNSQLLEPKQDDEVMTLIAVAEGSMDEEALSSWLKQYSKSR